MKLAVERRPIRVGEDFLWGYVRGIGFSPWTAKAGSACLGFERRMASQMADISQFSMVLDGALNVSDAAENFPVSVMIFTLNEEVHLPSCLAALTWCDDVIVVDSFSTDSTRQICEASGARFFEHGFEGFGLQRNWALDHTAPMHDWVLILDADERVPPELADELGRIAREDPVGVGAYRVRRRFHMWGRWLRYSSLYPTWVVRFIRKDRVRYVNRGHAETQKVEGELRDLEHDLIDENLKGIDEWFERQNRYSRKDAEYELEGAAGPLGLDELLARDPLVRRAAMKRLAWRMPGRPLMFFLYNYLWRRGFLDGTKGFMFCYMKSLYYAMVQIKKFDRVKTGKKF